MPDDPRDEIPETPVHDMSDRQILILMCERQRVSNLRMNRVHDTLVEHNSRLDTLEKWRTGLAGAWAASMFWLFGGKH